MPLSYVTSLTPQSNFPTCSPLSSFQIPCISTNSQKTCPTAIHHHHHALQIIITSNVHPSPISHLIPIKSHHPPLAKSNQKPTTSPLRSHSCMYYYFIPSNLPTLPSAVPKQNEPTHVSNIHLPPHNKSQQQPDLFVPFQSHIIYNLPCSLWHLSVPLPVQSAFMYFTETSVQFGGRPSSHIYYRPHLYDLSTSNETASSTSPTLNQYAPVPITNLISAFQLQSCQQLLQLLTNPIPPNPTLHLLDPSAILPSCLHPASSLILQECRDLVRLTASSRHRPTDQTNNKPSSSSS